jgi:hypothetical protein
VPHQELVFYVLLGFFVVIGLGSTAVLFGVIKAAPEFRDWATKGFAAGATSVIFGIFKVFDPAAAAAPAAGAAPTPIHVTLDAPAVRAPFKAGKFEYVDTKGNDTVVHKGTLNPVLLPGGWEVVLPGEASGHATSLHLQDRDGGWWETSTFYPNYMTQVVDAGKEFAGVRVEPWHVPGVAVLAAEASGLKINNYSKRIDDRYQQAFYQWRIFIDEPANTLATIEQVDYVLHPTFPEPFQTTRDRASKFALEQTGWGSFNVLVTIHYANGTQSKQTYFIDLNKGWPADAIKRTAETGMQLKLETIQVFEDGSAGPTSWSFDVLVDGQVALRLPSKGYDDDKSGKRGTSYPAEASQSILPVRIPAGRTARLEVRGKRTKASDTVTGQATVTAGGRISISVANPDPKKGSFVFLFAPATS